MAGMGEIVVVSGEWVVGNDTKGAGLKPAHIWVCGGGGYSNQVEGNNKSGRCNIFKIRKNNLHWLACFCLLCLTLKKNMLKLPALVR